MIWVGIYSFLLALGLLFSQLLEGGAWKGWCNELMAILLGYIMIKVGLEFVWDRSARYGKDYLIAMTAAALPWLFCAAYFVWFFALPWVESLIISRFAAPTSAGILFTLLTAAGLSGTWVFNKVRILAIFDDLDTILFLIPIQILLLGFQWSLIGVLALTLGLLVLAYRYLHRLPLPVSEGAILVYAFILWWACERVHLEILLPAFCLGAMLKPENRFRKVPVARRLIEAQEELIPTVMEKGHREETGYAWEEQPHRKERLDSVLKGLFMFLVGLSLTPVMWSGSIGMIVINVVVITLLSNIGKCFPLFCYRTEVNLKQRLAVSIALFPRGEVGGGILALSVAYQLNGMAIAIAGLSLALNLLLTGVFIYVVRKLLEASSPKGLKG